MRWSVKVPHNVGQTSRRCDAVEPSASVGRRISDRLRRVNRRDSVGRQAHLTNEGLHRRHVVSTGAFSLLLCMAVSGCGGARADTAHKANVDQQAPSTKSIVECGLNAVNEPLARTPDALKRAAQVYHLVDSTGNALGAFESVYGKTLPTFTYEEQAEALVILSGLDSCGDASVTAPGDIALLLSGQPGSTAPTADPTTAASIKAAPTTTASTQGATPQVAPTTSTPTPTPTPTPQLGLTSRCRKAFPRERLSPTPRLT